MVTTDTGPVEATPTRSGGKGIHTNTGAQARIKARNAADTRLKYYGILAIAVAAFALVALLYNVFIRAAQVVTEHYIEIPVEIAQGDDDFLSIQKSALRDAFPFASGRNEKKQLYDLLSEGAADDMRAEAKAGTLETGTATTRQMLASDTVDLYLRGDFGDLVTKAHSGALTLTENRKKIELASDAADFGLAVAFAKGALRDEVAKLTRQAGRQSAGIAVVETRLPGLTGDALAAAEAQIEDYTARRDQLLAEAAKIDANIDAAGAGRLKLARDMPSFFVQANGGVLKLVEVGDNDAVAVPLVPPASLASAASSDWRLMMLATPQAGRTISDLQVALVEQLRAQDKITSRFNARFFQTGDSTQPEIAGILGAVVGSLWTMLVTFCLAFPIGVLAAIYLEEFARKSWVTDFIEVNINNLAAVPSIVFGLLGLAVFLNFFGMPRSSPLAGGMVLALMTLPTVIIASRAALRAVPPSIRTAALGLGASKVQTVFHHVLPLAMPGILTGTIIGMAQALGETAPLLMIGMVAFITAIPEGVTDSATVLPVQIFQWANLSERAFDGRTAAAIVVLLCFLIVMNAIAIFLRKRFERRW